MKEEQRIINIMSELVKNSLQADAEDINVKIKRLADSFEITVEDDGKGMDDEILGNVQDKLNQPHRVIYDEYYSGLAGSHQTDSGLKIVGFQVDESEVRTGPEGTMIRVKRSLSAHERTKDE